MTNKILSSVIRTAMMVNIIDVDPDSQEIPSSDHPPRSWTKISLVGRDGSSTRTRTTVGLKLMEFRPQEMKPRKQLKSKIFLRSSVLGYFWRTKNLVWSMFHVPGVIVTIDVDHELITGANLVRAARGNY